MLWSDFYDGYWDWSDSTRRTRISSLEDIGPGSEIAEVVYDINDPKVKAQLVRKAMKLGAKFTPEDLMELEGEISDELCSQVALHCGFDPTYPFLDENNMSWEDFYDNYSGWDDATLERRIKKLTEFGSAEEIVDVVQCMPSVKLEKLVYERAVAAGITFTEDEKLAMRNWGDILRDAMNEFPSDEEIDQFARNVRTLCGEEEPAPQRAPRRSGGRGLLIWGAIIGILSGIHKHSKAKQALDSCNSRPPHYGYRYGRWYYGNGHRRGCEKKR